MGLAKAKSYENNHKIRWLYFKNFDSYGRRSHRSDLKKCFTFICKILIVPKTMSYFKPLSVLLSR